MSKMITGSNVKICATCDFWIGDRIPKLGGFAEIKNEDGKCFVTQKTGVPKKAMYGCNLWKKWGVLD